MSTEDAAHQRVPAEYCSLWAGAREPSLQYANHITHTTVTPGVAADTVACARNKAGQPEVLDRNTRKRQCYTAPAALCA
jgi:hypothetical protein